MLCAGKFKSNLCALLQNNQFLVFFHSFILLKISSLYQITHLGDDDEEPEFSSLMATELDEGETFFFHARDLQNLVMVDEMESLAPIMHCKVILDFFFRCVNRLHIYTFCTVHKIKMNHWAVLISVLNFF